MEKLLLTFVVLMFFQSGFSQDVHKKYTLVITNATIVDAQNDQVFSNRLLAISRDTIKAIDDTKAFRKYKADRYLDARGRFVLPGLWDMHVHFLEDTLIKENKALLPLFLAYGVTTVRDCGGNITPALFHWKKDIAAGRLDGPRIFTSGPRIDGHTVPWKGFLKVETPTEIQAALDTLEQMKVDFVKLYEVAISPEAYLQTVAMAERRGLKTSGHLPATVKATEASKAGLDALEHITSVLIGSSSKEDSIIGLAQASYQKWGKTPNHFPLIELAGNTYDSLVALDLYATLAKNRTAVVPTLFFQKVFSEITLCDHSQDSLLSYIDPKIQAAYQLPVKYAKKHGGQSREPYKNLMATFMKMTRQLQRAGVSLLAGSDCGPFSSYVYPGHSLQEELKLFVEAGLSPAEALQTATINSAKFMGVDAFYGSVEVGKSADLLIVDRNPLDNIAAIDGIYCVVSHSKFYSKNDLTVLLQSIRHDKPTGNNRALPK